MREIGSLRMLKLPPRYGGKQHVPEKASREPLAPGLEIPWS
jgi:hypothetical protein